MAHLLQPRERKASLPRHSPSPSPTSSYYPATPPRPTPSDSAHTPGTATAAARTPQMIRCSTCSCLVPLLELSEHVCRPSPPPGHNAHPQQQLYDNRHGQPSTNTGAAYQAYKPHAAPGLRVNISQAQQSSSHRLDSGLPTPYITPLPRSPASLSPSRSPGTSPANLSPHYARDLHGGGNSDSESERPTLSRSSSAQSNLSQLSPSSNNAGIGARLPFFEKYQRVYGNGSASGSEATPPTSAAASPVVEKASGYSRWTSAKDTTPPRISPTTTQQYPHQNQQQNGYFGNTHYQPHSRQASRETTASEKSSADDSSRDSDVLRYLNDETPDTSPDFPDTPVFRAPDHVDAQDTASRSYFDKQDDDNSGRRSRYSDTPQDEGEEEDGQSDEDDILDSYPTPQQTFAGRFGGLVIDDGLHIDSAPRTAPLPIASTSSELSRVSPSLARSPLLRDAHHHHQQHQPACSPQMRSFSRGLPMSHSTPDSLAKIAGGEDGGVGPSLSLNGKRRSRNGTANGYLPVSFQKNTPALSARGFPGEHGAGLSHAGSSQGLGLNALDDLLKEMNRDSLLGSNAPTRPPAAAAKAVCASCKKEIATKAIKKDGSTFCSPCYASLYLPRCRKCENPIEGKAIGSGDGKVKGKFHPACFSCFDCSAPFPSGDFYVFEQKPYCARHYHERNGTLCANLACTEAGIEGPCVSLVGEEGGNGGRYHPGCFICSNSSCSVLLDQWHYVLSGLPYCERHAQELEQQPPSPPSYGYPSTHTSVDYSSVDAYYDAAYSAHSSPIHAPIAAPAPYGGERRRSISAGSTAPTHLAGSISALRKNAQSPNYAMRGGMRAGYTPRPTQPPPAAQAYGSRRAEKRRTVIQRV